MSRHRKGAKILFFLAITLGGLVAFQASQARDQATELRQDARQEMYTDSTQTKLRPIYQSIADAIHQGLDPQFRRDFLKKSRAEFMNDNPLNSFPLLINAEKYDQTRKGVEQRARALLAFLQDHYSNREYVKAGIIPEDVIKKITDRTGETGYYGRLPSDIISFPYGPDLFGDTVLEDNTGFLGGPGDIKLAQDLILDTFPQIEKKLAIRPSHIFYDNLVNFYQEQAKKFGGRVVVLGVPPFADKEDLRLRRIFLQYGIPTVTPNTQVQLKVMPDGVYLTRKDAPDYLEKVGYVIIKDEHKDVDRGYDVVMKNQIVDEANEHLRASKTPKALKTQLRASLAENPIDYDKVMSLLNSNPYFYNSARYTVKTRGIPGLINAIFSRKVGTNYTPGADFVNDKEFYPYVEKLIRFYLKEEPLLKNIWTAKMSEVDRQKIYDNFQNYVIKAVDGRSGENLWVGPHTSSSDRTRMISIVEKNPELFMVQQYTMPSVLHDLIIDRRVITLVNREKVITGAIPWSRGSPLDGSGKVNLGAKGVEITPLIVEGFARDCRLMHREKRRDF